MPTARKGGLARRSVLLSFVVAVLAGSLVLVTARAAEAATMYGTVNTTDVSAPSGLYSMGCTVTASKAVQDGIAGWVRYTANCNRSPLLAAEDATHVSSWYEMTLVFIGSDDLAAPCTYVGEWDHSIDSPGNDTTTMGAGDCHVGQVCLDWRLHTHFTPDIDASQTCTTMVLSEPAQVSTASCTKVIPNASPTHRQVGNWEYWEMKFNAGVGYVASNQWTPYVIYADLKRGGNATGVGGVAYPTGFSYQTPTTDLIDSNGVYASYYTGSEPIGFGVYLVSGVSPTPQGGTPQQVANGALGVTDPSKCQFYWGEKVASVTGSDIDEPIAPLPGQPGPPAPDTNTGDSTASGDSGCGFSLSDPGSWASAGMCAAVGLLGQIAKLLGQIVGAIAGLAADIAGAIMDALGGLLNDLFVPDDAPSFSDVPNPLPTGWLPSLPSVSAGTCGAITLGNLDLGPMGGDTGTTTLLDTCEDPWPLARNLVYNGLLAVVLLAAVVRAFRAITNALGIGVEQGSGSGDDE